MPPLVYTIILNFNNWADTIACLQSLASSDYANNHVIVLNADAAHAVPEQVEKEFPGAEIIPIAENKGFAGNNNQGIRYAISQNADWVFVLNDDTLLAPDCISKLVAVAESDPHIGLVGPLIYHADEPDVIQSAGGYMDAGWHFRHHNINQTDQGQVAADKEVDWLNGCGFLCRAETFRRIGLFDERFFLYNEEAELCFRARENGWKIWMTPQAKMWHKGVNRNYRPGPNVTYYMVRNHLLFLHLHRAPLTIKALAWYQGLRMVASYTLRPKWKDRHDHRDAALQGMRDFLLRRWGRRA